MTRSKREGTYGGRKARNIETEKRQDSLDRRIAEALSDQARKIEENEAGEDAFRRRVLRQIKEETAMKRGTWNIKKVAAVAAAICVLGSATVMAASRFAHTVSSSSSREEITDHQEIGALAETYQVPFEIKGPEAFTNGFAFESARPVHTSAEDGEGGQTELPTGVALVYGKEGMTEVSLYENQAMGNEEAVLDGSVHTAAGIDYYYSLDTYKFVPPSYELTEEDEAKIMSGELNVSYGSDEVEVTQTASVNWVSGGVCYSMITFDTPLTETEMVRMAQEVMGSGQ